MINHNKVLAQVEQLQATLGIAPVSNFVSSIVTIPDEGNTTPHSCLFLPPQNKWPNFFVKRMKELLVKAEKDEWR